MIHADELTNEVAKYWLRMHACEPAVEWLEDSNFTSMEDAWNACTRADWMLWCACMQAGHPGASTEVTQRFFDCSKALLLAHITLYDKPGVRTDYDWARLKSEDAFQLIQQGLLGGTLGPLALARLVAESAEEHVPRWVLDAWKRMGWSLADGEWYCVAEILHTEAGDAQIVRDHFDVPFGTFKLKEMTK